MKMVTGVTETCQCNKWDCIAEHLRNCAFVGLCRNTYRIILFPNNYVIYGFLNVGADTELNTLSTQQISSPLMERKETLGYGK